MTLLDPSTAAPAQQQPTATSLADDLRGGTPFALAFGGQGGPWLEPLEETVRAHGLGADVVALVTAVERRLEPLAGELLRVAATFDPIGWLDARTADDQAGPTGEHLTRPAVSVPGIALAQLTALAAVDHALGSARPVAVVGHSQGALLAAAVRQSMSADDVLTLARLIGAAAELTGRRRGLTGATMVSVSSADPTRVVELTAGTGAVAAIRNGRRAVVLSGSPAAIESALAQIEAEAAREGDLRARKLTGGSPFRPVIEPLDTDLAFHHPDLAGAADLVERWAPACGLDPVRARELTDEAILAPVDWVDAIEDVADSGAHWLIDVGPGDLASRLSASEARARGIGVVSFGTPRGLRELVVVGASPRRPRAWSEHLPKVVTLPGGSVVTETAFTRLTGKSPVLLAGMTPTTVDPAIVAAAANAGFWAELAGGGQVTEEVFAENLQRLDSLLAPGATWQFNSLLLDPYLWKLQLGQQRLLQRARLAGAAVDGVVVTAGVPEPDEAAALIDDLREVGISHIAFKPGTVAQIRRVLAIAKEAAPFPVIVQIEGGKAGGHHSWEDLDDLLVATYADLRGQDNVVVCVGGGIGTPDVAARYLTGAWSLDHGQLPMPLDGVLVGTAAMATLEATTSPQVKQLLVQTQGSDDWVGAGSAAGGMASGRSQLGADIHEIDNAASATGRLLDEVAGDADAVAARRDEIIVALDRTAKPYFGDLTTMTYGSWLQRFLDLCWSDGWIDRSFRTRFHAMLQRAEARLAEADRGEIVTLFATDGDVSDGFGAMQALRLQYPAADDVVLHPADRPFFVDVCRQPGKPVTFVPVVDADVRRWWRSDSLWQAHDPRYPADQVCVIPGIVAVAGITRVDEPVADLLRRFEEETTDALLAAGAAPARVAGRRRAADDVLHPHVSLLLASADVHWAGRTVPNPVRRVGKAATFMPTDAGVKVRIDLGTVDAIELDVIVGDAVAHGALPVVTEAAASAAMHGLAAAAAGGSLPDAAGGTVDAVTALGPDLVADHAAVTGAERTPRHGVPDVLVGLAWPAVFALVSSARASDGTAVVEGMLDLVHLDHSIALDRPLPTAGSGLQLQLKAALKEIVETDLGRVVAVEVEFHDAEQRVATLRERFVIRGRAGAATVTDPLRAGGAATDAHDRPRKRRVGVRLTAPGDLRAFALVTGDHNPIHTSQVAAQLAGLGDPIVHGMWTSAAAQQQVALATGRRISGWTTRFLAPVRRGAALDVRADRVGMVGGAEVLDVVVRADGDLVMSASARVEPPRTAYAFPGQGIQSRGMGMAGYQRSAAARDIWDRADAHTRKALGFSILTVVRDNPTTLVAADVTHRHPDGVLFLTQFTQVAMAVLGAAQMAELRESGAVVEGAVLAGHSVGEYNALAAVSGVIPLEAVIEVVFQRGSVMHGLVPRDADGNSDYRLAAIRPSQIGLADDEVKGYVDSIAQSTGEFCQIVNYNLRGSQYAIAGTIKGLAALEADIADRRARFGGKAAFILVPGIDVPFHSQVLHGGVPDFKARLEELLPATIDPAILTGRYVPNLVARPFSLDEDFITCIEDYVGASIERSDDPAVLCRRVLIELLAWQFASPVRWIETQDLLFAPVEKGGLGVERFIEVGVGSAPTIANLASATLKLPGYPAVEVANLERDAAVVFGTDEDVPDEPEAQPEIETGTSPAPAAEQVPDAAPARVAPAAGPRPDDLAFGPAEAARVLVVWWTKLRLDQLGATDSIESLCDGASSRRNQLLVDLGSELGLGAIDGAADADLPALGGQVNGLARGYKPFGSVLSEALGDHLRKVLGPSGRKPAAIEERVTGVWQLGPGWSAHVFAELAMATRDGASVRGGGLGPLAPPASAGEVDEAIDACVRAVAARAGVSVELPTSESAGGTIDASALAEVTGRIDDALEASARTLLERLGVNAPSEAVATDDGDAAEVLARVEAELGRDWIRATAPVFDARRAVLLDDRWASAREDVARLAVGLPVSGRFNGTGEVVAAQARWWADHVDDDLISGQLLQIAAQAQDVTPGCHATEVALVTGAGPDSIAAAVVASLLAEGATVVATTSRLSSRRLAQFKKLYRDNARAGARLHVVPANLASFADVDALAAWVHDDLGLTPTLLFPFAAGSVSGAASDAGSRAEIDARILLWSVERLVGLLAARAADVDLRHRLHVVLPGSPNRGTFGGDGAYGEAKAALDAFVAKQRSEPQWGDRVTFAHAIIGWVRGTGLMGANDPLVEAVEAAGVQTWTPEQMAAALLDEAVDRARLQGEAVTLDLTGGLGSTPLDLRALAAQVAPPSAPQGTPAGSSGDADGPATIAALPPSPTAILQSTTPRWGSVDADLDDMVVIVGAGELGPYGSSRTRFEVEVSDRLSAAGVLELAWTTGLVRWDLDLHSWVDTASGDRVDEADIADRYESQVRERTGVRRYADDGAMVDNTAPLLVSVFLDEDLTFSVANEAEALAMRSADPDHTRIAPATDGWTVTRLSGTEIRVPRRLDLTRTVGGQIPTGFDPSVWGIPAEMIESTDRVALWNLVCTVDAFCSSGFSPAELMRWVHPAMVANTQGTGMGGMESMRSLYIDTLLGEPKANDILQEALPNVIAAHVAQSYVGGYGAMVHPVAACATTAVSVEEGTDKIRLGKADFVVAGGFDDLSIEGIVGFGAMSATADSQVMADKGIDPAHFSRANDRRYGGFVESQGGGTVLLARGSVAAELGLPVLGVVAYAASFADGIHSSIPAPGLGALSAGRRGTRSALALGLTSLGVGPDDIAVLSKHDTSTGVNERNESELHERLATALGRSDGNPLFVMSQKALTGHAKGGAAAFQLIGLCQVLAGGVIPPNRSLDCVLDDLAQHERLVWLREPLPTGPLKAGLLTSLGFGHVAGLIAVVHPQAFVEALPEESRERWLTKAAQRVAAGRMRLAEAMVGGAPLYQRPPGGRRLGSGEASRELEAQVLLDAGARLASDGVYGCRA